MSRPGPNNPPNNGQQPPVSYRTVPGRNRTQKWQQARTVDYGGDDWGGYDIYDEYMDDLPEQQQARSPTSSQYPSSRQPTSPPAQYPQQPQQRLPRANSFDRGDEGRAFSANPSSASQNRPYDARVGTRSPEVPDRNPNRPRDFSDPEYVPAPLNTRVSVSGPRENPENQQRNSTTSPVASPSSASADSPDKPLPFIRPSDIYKRMAESKARESSDVEKSTQPTPDFVQRETGASGSIAPPIASSGFGRSSPLNSVAEGRESIPSSPTSLTGPNRISQSLGPLASAPLAERTPTTSGTSTIQPASSLQHSPSVGFRSAVEQAFDRNNASLSRDGSQSTTAGSGVHRSDTTSTGTTNISPIIKQESSFPSTSTTLANAALPGSTQKPSDAPALQSNRGSIMRKKLPGSGSTITSSAPPIPAPIETSFEPGYRRSLDPPASGTTPIHHPVVVESSPSSKRLSGPMVAETVGGGEAEGEQGQANTLSEAPPPAPISKDGEVNEGGGIIPLSLRIGSDLSLREADLVDNINGKSTTSPINVTGEKLSTPTITEAVRASRHLFLDNHPGTPGAPPSPIASKNIAAIGSPSPTQSPRSNSPTKGRVRDLAEKIETRSRRGSASSIGSVSSLTKSAAYEIAGASIAVSDAFPRPDAATREPSFVKPDMPGGWVSSAPTPAIEVPPVITADISPSLAQSDITPTTKKVQLQEITPSFAPTSTSKASSGAEDANVASALDAVKNAGAQLGSSLLATVGLGHESKDFGNPATGVSSGSNATPSKPFVGQRSAAPPPLDRFDSDDTVEAQSSTASSSIKEDAPAPLRLNSNAKNLSNPPPTGSNDATSFSPQQSTQTSTSTASPIDETSNESDRLRREIVRSLDASTHNTPSKLGSDSNKTETAKDDRQRIQDALDASAAAASFKGLDAKPILDQRFSWESRPAHKQQASVSEYLLPKSSYTPRSRPTSPSALKTSFGTDAAAAREETKSPEIKPVAAYERPRNKELNVVNAEVEAESPAAETTPKVVVPSIETTEDGAEAALPPLPLPKIATNRSQENLLPAYINKSAHSPVSLRSPSPSGSDKGDLRPTSYYLSDLSPEALINDETEHGIDIVALRSDSVASSYVADDLPDHADDPLDNADAASQFTAAPTIVPTSAPSAPAIPAFKTILAIPDAPSRIATYAATRQTFSNMNTGLDAWITGMIARNPAYENLEPAPPQAIPSGSGALGTLRRVAVGAAGSSGGAHGHHRQSPSITLGKLATRFGGGGAAGANDDDTGRPGSPSPHHNQYPDPGTAGSQTPATAGPSNSASAASPGMAKVVDMDKMQQRGKDFMKSAGVFGGKAQAGALGLLAKGRNRLAGGSERSGSGGAGNAGGKVSSSPVQSSPLSATASANANAIPNRNVSTPTSASTPTAGIAPSNTNTPVTSSSRKDHLLASPLSSHPPTISTTDLALVPVSSSDLPPHQSAREAENVDPRASVSSIPNAVTETASSSRDDLRRRSLLGAFRRRSADIRNLEAESLAESAKSSLKGNDREGQNAARSDSLDAGELAVLAAAARVVEDAGGETTVDGNGRDESSLEQVTTQESVHGSFETAAENATVPARRTTFDAASDADRGRQSVTDVPRPARALTTIVGGRLKSENSTSRSPHGAGRRSRPTSEIMEKGFLSKLKNFSRRISLVAPDDKKSQEELGTVPAAEPGLVRTDSDGIIGSMSLDGWDQDVASKSEQNRLSRIGAPILPSAADKNTAPPFENARETTPTHTPSGKPIRVAPPIPMNPPRRFESWDAPDADLPPRTPRNNSATSALLAGARLGILPSPATTMHEGSSPIKRALHSSGGEDRARAKELGGLPDVNEGEAGESVDHIGERRFGDRLVEEQGEKAATVAPVLPSSEAGEPNSAVATHARRTSDLTTLPSQRRTAPNSPAIETSESLARVLAQLRDSQGRDLTTTPPRRDNDGQQEMTAPVAETSASRESPVKTMVPITVASSPPRAVFGETMAESPVAVDATRKESGFPDAPVSPTVSNTIDARSDNVSPPADVKIATLAPDGDNLDRIVSRDSPVSSLGEPSPPAEEKIPPLALEDTRQTGNLAQLKEMQAYPLPAAQPNQQYVRNPAAIVRPSMPDRPMSFAPQPRDANGRLIPEQINTTRTFHDRDPETPAPNVDLSDLTGPPVGSPPFQQHPALRGTAPTAMGSEYADLRSSNAASGISPNEPGRDPAQRSQSGFFRSRASSSGPNTLAAASNISDLHGLEDVHAAQFTEVDIDAEPTAQGKPSKQQRNSMWKSLGTKRGSEQGRADAAPEGVSGTELRQNSADASKPLDEAPRPNTLKKLQRTSSSPATSQVDLKPNKKRFSGFGALFGRSDAAKDVVSSKPKSNRLTKRDTRQDSGSQDVLPSGTVVGHVDNYRAFEALQRQNSDDVSAMQGRQVPRRSESNDQTLPVPDGWFDANPLPEQQGPVRAQSITRPGYRQTYTGGSSTLEGIPEAFRPVSASFVGSVDPIGPPVESPQPAQGAFASTSNPIINTRPVPSQAAQAQRISPQQYQQQHDYFQGLQQAPPAGAERTQRGAQSLDIPRGQAQYEYGYGPENQHADHQGYNEASARQQAPWAIAIPSGAPQNGQARPGWQGRPESYVQTPAEFYRRGPPEGPTSPARVSPGEYPTYVDERSQGPVDYSQSQTNQTSAYQQLRQSQQHYPQQQPKQQYYQQRQQPPARDYQQQTRRTQPSQDYYAPSHASLAQQQRFYASNTNDYDPIYDHAPMYTQENRPPAPPRQPSGGRIYHDPTHHHRTAGFPEHGTPPFRRNTSDEVVPMRGASYPGQEWEPSPPPMAEGRYPHSGRMTGGEHEWRG